VRKGIREWRESFSGPFCIFWRHRTAVSLFLLATIDRQMCLAPDSAIEEKAKRTGRRIENGQTICAGLRGDREGRGAASLHDEAEGARWQVGYTPAPQAVTLAKQYDETFVAPKSLSS
jgi:hypothetical protein